LREKAEAGDEEARRALEEAGLWPGEGGEDAGMSLVKLWAQNRRELTDSEKQVLGEMLWQAGGDVAEALNFGAVSIHSAAGERARLNELIKAQRLEIQRLQFPGLYANVPEGAEAVAQRIYEMAARAVELMQREGMQDEYDVTFNSLSEIARYGQPLCPVAKD
jgi:hypothetical protein